MIGPENVIVHCPNGHELQAAREHLTTALSCPMCGVEFVPQAGVVQTLSPPAIAPGSQAPPGYAGSEMLRQPVEYPGVTTPMIWLFLIAAIAQVVGTFVAYLMHDELIAAQTSNPPNFAPIMMTAAPGCVYLLCWIVGIVLHLLWINRIHQDAKRAGDYTQTSPGLALGVSFIPWFNYIWTGMTMRGLSRFAAERSATADETQREKSRAAVSAAGQTMIAGVILAIVNLGIAILNSMVSMSSALSVFQSGGNVNPEKIAEQANMIPPWVAIVAAGIGLVCTLIYFIAVPRLEAALYPVLGAPPK